MVEAAGGPNKALKLTYHEKSPPFAAIAIAQLLGIRIEPYADPKFAADAVPVLQLSHR